MRYFKMIWKNSRFLAVAFTGYFFLLAFLYCQKGLMSFGYDLETEYAHGGLQPKIVWPRLDFSFSRKSGRPKILMISKFANQTQPEYQALMNCYRGMKLEYAAKWDLHYIDNFILPVDDQLLPRRRWMWGRKQGTYSKLSFIEYIMRNQRNDKRIPDDIEWFFWIDGDTVFSNPDVNPYERVVNLTKMYERQRESKRLPPKELTMIWADHNAGVFFLRNTYRAYSFIYRAHHTYVPFYESWTDQSSFKQVLTQNQDLNSSILLLSHDEMDLIQQYGYREDGVWITHFPGKHNSDRTRSAQRFCTKYKVPIVDIDKNVAHRQRIMRLIKLDIIPMTMTLAGIALFLSIATLYLRVHRGFRSKSR
mmetsp:Transcript_8360/g.10042  ORF Transcript_8360/g.10042 Transcript_8360/m.10042 type:complete len:363 (+) Transcript_8360:89-1177(+)